MKLIFTFLVQICLSSFVLGQDANQIIEKYLNSAGGQDRWEMIHSMKDSMISHSVEDIYQNNPQLLRSKIMNVIVASKGRYKYEIYQDSILRYVSSYDGIKRYSCLILPNEVRKTTSNAPELLSSKKEGENPVSEIFSILRAKKIDYLGLTSENTHHILKVTKQSGEVSLMYFNVSTHLLEKSHLDEPTPRFTSHYLNYQEVDGLLVPMVQETRNSKGDLVMRFEKIKVQFNLDLPDDFFTLE